MELPTEARRDEALNARSEESVMGSIDHVSAFLAALLLALLVEWLRRLLEAGMRRVWHRIAQRR